MTRASLITMTIALTAPAVAAAGSDGPPAPQDVALDEFAFYDRLHQTFQLLCGVAHQAYFDHFRDEPDNLGVVHFYAGRLAVSQNHVANAVDHFRQSFELADKESYYAFYSSDWLRRLNEGTVATKAAHTKLYDAYWGTGPQSWMRAALAYVVRTDISNPTDYARYFMGQLEFHPHIVLQRTTPVPAPELRPEQWSLSPMLAVCPLYDPELLWVHRRLAERKSSPPSIPPQAGRDGVRPVEAAGGVEPLAAAQLEVRTLREQPENRELSLRKFLDQHRTAVWRLGWLYRCRGLELERTGEQSAAPADYLRGWAIGDALFPVAMRGRLDRFDPVFLAELGDVYARLRRYDLMLRYMYSDVGLPARYEIARPIAELARVAEAVRLTRSDETLPEQAEELLPETVSQILFEQPVPKLNAGIEPTIASTRPRSSTWGWVFLGGGFLLLLIGIAWRLSLAGRRSAETRRV